MQQAVEDGGGDDQTAEDLTPFADCEIGRQQDAAAFAATADELEEDMCGVGLDGQRLELTPYYIDRMVQTTEGRRFLVPPHVVRMSYDL